MNKKQVDTSPMEYYHIINENEHYIVYSPKLVKKGAFRSKKEAIVFIEKSNNSRLPIYVHKSNGLVTEFKRCKKVKKIVSVDTGKIKSRNASQGVRILHG